MARLMLVIVVLLCWSVVATANDDGLPFTVAIEELQFSTEIPALHSYSLAEADGEWLVIGGLTHGMHGDGTKIFATGRFPKKNFNDRIWVIDPRTGEVWSTAVPEMLKTSLVATNAQHCQPTANSLYIIGGYTWVSENFMDTLDVLTVISDVRGLIAAVKGNRQVEEYFEQLHDKRFRVTGGELKHLGDTFYLAVGNDFIGQYLSGEVQKYTLEIRRFRFSHDPLAISHYSTLGEQDLFIRESTQPSTLACAEQPDDIPRVLDKSVTDTMQAHRMALYKALANKGESRNSPLRRRDLNVVYTVFPNEEPGLIILGGGFRFVFPTFLMHQNPIFVSADKIFGEGQFYAMHDKSFEQTMSQYTCPHLLIYDSETKSMHMTLFGGLSMYVYNTEKKCVEIDRLLPYINNVSVTTVRGGNKASQWFCEERILHEQQHPLTISNTGYFGTNAKFMFSEPVLQFAMHPVTHEVIDFGKLRELADGQPLLVGYMYGGIYSEVSNCGETRATNRIFSVTISCR